MRDTARRNLGSRLSAADHPHNAEYRAVVVGQAAQHRRAPAN